MSDKKIPYVYIDDLTEDQLEKLAKFDCTDIGCNDCCFDTEYDYCAKRHAKAKLQMYEDDEDNEYENITISKGPLLKHKIIKE